MTIAKLHRFLRLSSQAVLLAIELAALMRGQTAQVSIAPIRKQCRAGGNLPALNVLVRAVTTRPKDAQLLACFAEANVRNGREPAAIGAYQKSLAIDPRNPGAWGRLGALQRRALESSPSNHVLRLSFIETLLHTGPESDVEREIASFLKSAPTDAQLELTSALIGAGKSDLAMPILLELSKAEPIPPEVHAQLGLILMEKADYERAVMELGHAAQARPKESRYGLALSEALLRWHHYSIARDFLQAVKGDFGSLPQFQYNLAYSYYGLRELDTASSILTALLKQKPGYAPALFLLGNCYVAQGNLARAEQLLRQAVAADDTHPAYYASVAQVERYQGKLSEALATLQKGLALDPRDPELIFESALCHENKGELSIAQKQLEELLTMQPSLAKAHRALARVYGRMGNGAAAEGERQKLVLLESKEGTSQNSEENR